MWFSKAKPTQQKLTIHQKIDKLQHMLTYGLSTDTGVDPSDLQDVVTALRKVGVDKLTAPQNYREDLIYSRFSAYASHGG